MKNKIPKLLLYSRLFFALLIITITIYPLLNSKIIVLVIMYLGIVTDVFDGLIARELNISTENFRVLDTVFDLLFYFTIFFFIISVNHHVFLDNKIVISIILFLEFLMYTISMIRFGKLPSPHAILSKFWGLYIITEFSLILCQVKGNHFFISLIIGILVHLDRVLIYILIRNWEHDVLSSYHALRIRQGRNIKRIKLFNG
jgi:Phosphatidylglycerophosphate synthase